MEGSIFGKPSPIYHHENSITNLKNVVLVLVNNEDIVPFGRIRFFSRVPNEQVQKIVLTPFFVLHLICAYF